MPFGNLTLISENLYFLISFCSSLSLMALVRNIPSLSTSSALKNINNVNIFNVNNHNNPLLGLLFPPDLICIERKEVGWE